MNLQNIANLTNKSCFKKLWTVVMYLIQSTKDSLILWEKKDLLKLPWVGVERMQRRSHRSVKLLKGLCNLELIIRELNEFLSLLWTKSPKQKREQTQLEVELVAWVVINLSLLIQLTIIKIMQNNLKTQRKRSNLFLEPSSMINSIESV